MLRARPVAINPQWVRLTLSRAAFPVLTEVIPYKVTAACTGAIRAPVARGIDPRPNKREPSMSHNLNLARRHALSLAKTLMVCVTLFKEELGYGVVPSDEFEGDPATIICEYDPFAA